MVKINNRFIMMPRDYLFKEIGEARASLASQLKSEGKPNDIIAIGIGDPDIPTPAPIVEKIQRELETYRGYPDYEGIPELRQAIAEYYKPRFGVDLSYEDVIIGDGAKSDLSHMALAFANSGDHVALQDPTYPVYVNWSCMLGLDVFKMPCTPENNFFGEIPEYVLDDWFAIIWICSPNNPTGAVASQDYLETIVQQAYDYDALVVHDIAYANFRPGNEKPVAPSIFSIRGSEEVAIELGSFSKPYSMTNHRLSWVAAKNPELIKIWGKLRSNFDSGVPDSIQWGGITALTSCEVADIVEKNMAEYGKRAKVLKQGFENIGCTVYGLGHSPYAWVRIPAGYTSKEFSLKLLNEAHVVTAWGSGFGDCGEGYIRATVFQKKEKIEEAMERLQVLF